jgi:hypothetical protein
MTLKWSRGPFREFAADLATRFPIPLQQAVLDFASVIASGGNFVIVPALNFEVGSEFVGAPDYA